ncbi:MAG: hypothetical protein BroJett011_71580 [Chloroflexota bacterium]|nr:MAG: hypothetical protein BroJett011_71580 [Chloroflexota bacterium]
MAISKSEARKLTINVTEMGAQVLRGVLTVGPDGATINNVPVLEWLAQHAGVEIMLIATPVGNAVTATELKTCSRCGRDYKGDACPHCAEARARLRG